MNETIKVLKERFSCRDFTNEGVTKDQMHLITQAAIQSPSAMNRQPWHFIVITNKEVLNELETKAFKTITDPAMKDRILSRGGKVFYNAPAMIVIARKEGSTPVSGVLDIGIAAQNIVIAATSLGLSTVHCGMARLVFEGNEAESLRERFQFPEGYVYETAILIGHGAFKGTPHTLDQSKITIIE